MNITTIGRGTRDVTQQLNRDADYQPESIGGLENARALEDFVPQHE